jgi:dephospho-CoA kinase
MIRVALTGGIATGKSYCLARFGELGAPTIDSDELARNAVAPGTTGLAAVRRRFGAGVMKHDGALDREALASVVFADPIARRDLESIVHPLVYRGIEQWMKKLAQDGREPAAIAGIPLLFESGHDPDFDVVIATLCSRELQLERLRARGLSLEESVRRIESQMPADAKAERAGHVIDTNGSFETTDAQVRRIWSALTAASGPR